MRISLHNHSTWCDGECTPEEIVWAAIEGGLSHVAITDHLDSEKLRPLVGITAETMPDYVAEARDLAAQYADHITVLAAVEIDFNRERTPFDLFATPARAEEVLGALDFVLFEYVQDPYWSGESLHAFLEFRKNIAAPVGLAHPDLMVTFSTLLPEAAAGVLAENDVFLELCPSRRNAVLDMAKGGDPEEMEREAVRMDAEYQKVLEKLEEDPENPDLLNRMDEILLSMDPRVPSYRTLNPFVDAFFDAVRGRGVLLSIGTDSHGHWEEVNEIEDAVEFVEERDLTGNIITNHRWQR
ncbi:MAG: PHP domain-containing protein [Planctomycetes bacterium]|nr:PHP domain-containing protein [Planctomycetota bacterium]